MPKAESARRIELQRNEVEDILGRVPGWITRNGVILFLFLLALLLFGSWVFKYPDTKKARIVVTSVNPPADIKARATGKIVRLFVSNNEAVQNGDVLVMLENPAAYDEVVQLKNSLTFLDSIEMEEITEDLPELRNAQLGTIQSDYSIFLKEYRDYMEFIRIDYHQRKIQTARTELEKQQEYTRSLSERLYIQQQAYEMASRQFNRDFTLREQGVISDSDLEGSRSAMLTEQDKRQEIISQMAENKHSQDPKPDSGPGTQAAGRKFRNDQWHGRGLQQFESLHQLLGTEFPPGGSCEWVRDFYKVLERESECESGREGVDHYSHRIGIYVGKNQPAPRRCRKGQERRPGEHSIRQLSAP